MFDLDGRIIEPCVGVDVYKTKDILMVVFMNNQYLPIQVGHVNNTDFVLLSVVMETLAIVEVGSLVELECDDVFNVTDVCFSMKFSSKLVEGYLRCGICISWASHMVRADEVHSWLQEVGVDTPKGCCWTKGVLTEWSCDTRAFDGFIRVDFENGMKLPVPVDKFNMFTVRIQSIGMDWVSFHFFCSVGPLIKRYNSILYNRDGVFWQDGSIGISKITKMLVLGGS